MIGTGQIGAGVVANGQPRIPDGLAQVSAYVRTTIGGLSYRWASTEAVWRGEPYEGRLLEWPEVADVAQAGWGLRDAGAFSVRLSNHDGALLGLGPVARGAQLSLELVSVQRWLGGGESHEAFARTLVVRQFSAEPAALTLECAGLEQSALDVDYPPLVFSAEDFPGIAKDDVGTPVPEVVGVGRKVRCAYLSAGPTEWVYGACVWVPDLSVLTVYRDGRIVSASEYTVGSLAAASGWGSVLTLTFVVDQVDPQGRAYVIECDVNNPATRNPLSLVRTLLSVVAGLPVSISAFEVGEAAVSGAGSVIDVAFGRERRPRSLRSVLDDLLRVSRAVLYLTPTGEYAPWVDSPADYTASLSPASGDPVAVSGFSGGEVPRSVEVRYHPAWGDASRLQHTIKRDIAGGTGRAEPVELPLVCDHVTADKHACYLVQRVQRTTCTGTVYGRFFALGARIHLSGTQVFGGDKTFLVAGGRRTGNSMEVDLIEYLPAAYVYAPGPLPEDGAGYQPDYSMTRPAAPTGLTVAGQGKTTDAAGTVECWVDVRAVPPAVNWREIRLWLVHGETGAITMGVGEAALVGGGGVYRAVLPGLQPGATYSAWASCTSPTGLDGYRAGPVAVTTGSADVTPGKPAAPTFVSSAATRDGDGKVTSSATVRAVAPDARTERMVFRITNTNTAENADVRATAQGGFWVATAATLRPGQPHSVVVLGVNKWGEEGPSSDPCAFTTATDSTVPGTITGLSVAQGTGTSMSVRFDALQDADLRDYEIGRSTVSGGPFTVRGYAATNAFVDNQIVYGSTYWYRVRGRDASGNAGPYSYSSGVTAGATVDKPDIVDGAVTTRKTGSQGNGTIEVTGSTYKLICATGYLPTSGGEILITGAVRLDFSGGTGNASADVLLVRSAGNVSVDEWLQCVYVGPAAQFSITFPVAGWDVPTQLSTRYELYARGSGSGGTSVHAVAGRLTAIELKR